MSAYTLNLYVTIGLVVLIWLVQILQYPFFRYLDRENFLEAMLFHQNRITIIVMPLMAAEIIICILLTVLYPSLSTYLQMALVTLIWLSTFFIQVPLHNQLLNGPNLDVIKKLTLSNWIRTGLWTLKLILLLTIF